MAIEWSSVDIGPFSTLPRSDEHLSAVVEAKPKDHSCLNVKSKAQYYAEQPERLSCNRLIVTDGIRYGIYFSRGEVFRNTPNAYLNLIRMREEYFLLQCKGSRDSFLSMSPDWVPNSVEI